MIRLKTKSAKENVNRLFTYFVLLLLILITIFNLAIAEDDTNTSTNSSNTNRTTELGYSSSIAITILIIIIAAIAVYSAIDYAASKKHIIKAKVVAKKAKIMINQYEQEEREKKEKEKELNRKATQRKKVLQKDIEERRRIKAKLRKLNMLSEFEVKKEGLIEPNPVIMKRLKKKRVKTFISLHELGKDKNIKKRKPKQKVNKDKDLFDQLEELGE